MLKIFCLHLLKQVQWISKVATQIETREFLYTFWLGLFGWLFCSMWIKRWISVCSFSPVCSSLIRTSLIFVSLLMILKVINHQNRFLISVLCIWSLRICFIIHWKDISKAGLGALSLQSVWQPLFFHLF